MLRAIVTVFLFMSFMNVAEAHRPQRGKIFGSWGPYLYRSFPDGNYVGADAPVLGGAHFAVEGDIDKNGGLEIGLTYLHQLYFREKNGVTLVEKVKRIRASTGYRHWFGRDISAALFFTNAYAMGTPEVSHTTAGYTKEFKTAAHDVSDNGMELSLQYEFINGEKTSGVVDLRYTYSFSAHSDEIPDLYGVVFSVKHFIQSSVPDADAQSK